MDAFAPADPAVRTIRELIDHQACARGDEIFLISPETGRTLTFKELRRELRSIAGLLSQAGLEPGDKAAFLMDNGLFTAQLFLGTMYAGMVTVPLNVRAGADQLAYTMEHCDAKVVFVEDQYAALAEQALAPVKRTVRVIPVEVDEFASECGVSPAEDGELAVPAPEAIALLMYTSGSVGQPKAAIHSHRTVLAHGRNSRTSHQLTAADRSLLVLPIYHINAECVTLMPALFGGGSVVVPHHFNVSQFWDWLEQYHCTWSAVVPTIISQLLDWKDPKAGEREATFKRLRFIRSSSAPLSPSLQREFMEKFPIRLIQAMGSSEAGNIFSNSQAPEANKLGTPGLAWGFETRIVNPDGADVAAGEPGEVLLRGPAVTRAYYKDPEQTAAVFDGDGWLHTGDLAYQDPDGYFFVIGRSKELIIKGGMNIAPRQIDEVLESHPSVLEAAVVGVPDRYVGEDLIAFAVLRSGASGDEKAMLAFCESRLGHFKTPTRVHFVADLPKGPSGKVQRLRMLDEAVRLGAAAPVYNSGRTEPITPLAAMIEETIAQIWAEVLGEPRIGADANFFSLGGHSLMAIQCLSRMRDKLPIALSLADFFEHPTIAQQVALVRQRMAPAGQVNGQAASGYPRDAAEDELQPIPLRPNRSSHPLSSGQRRVWFFEELAPGVPLYNESETVRLAGELDPGAIEQALNLIVARHDMLRTTITVRDEGPIAVVHHNWPLTIKRIDLSGLALAEREAEVARLLIDEPRLPYNLDRVPGVRATLLRLSPTDHIFILMMHHLVCDWASEGVLWREFSAAYRAIVRGEPPELPSLPIQYGDYAVWQQRRVAAGIFNRDLDFWADNLRDAPEVIELPSDRPRPSVQSWRGARQRFRLNAALTEAMRNRSREEKASLFAVFAAAFQTLLYRYTGSEDIVLGIPIAEREQDQLRSMMGFLLHTQALRTRLAGDMTFREVVARVGQGSVALYSHREVPFEQVASGLHPGRSLSHSPIFQVMINWRDQNQHLSYVGLEGLAVESLLSETKTSKFDLTLMLTDFGREIWLEAEYSTDLFDDDRIMRMFGHYQAILEAVAANPELTLAEFPLLTAAERRQLTEWNATEAAFPDDRCIHQLFEAQVERTPDAIAVVSGGEALTYGELNQRANQLARHLRTLGVKPDDLVAISLERSIGMMVGLLGIHKAGGAYVPLDPAYPPERLAFMLKDAGAALVVTQSSLSESFAGRDCAVLCLDTVWPLIAQEAASNLEPAARASNLAYVIYTSGSTGQPKGVAIEHRAMANLLCAMSQRPGLAATDSLLAVTTLSFDIAGLELFLPLIVGAKLIVANRATAIDGGALIALLRDSGATMIQATPITFRMLIEAGWCSVDGRTKVLCGGEALLPALADQILEQGAELWNCYGPTETTVWSSVTKITQGEPITIGRPIANTQFHILDNQGQPCPIGRVGELHIGGAGLARGYWRRAELTSERFVTLTLDGPRATRLYKTGDLARFKPDGSVECLGRIDHQVKLRGFRIELGEIEAVLARHAGIAQGVVVAREDTPGDKRLVAYIVAADPQAPPPIEELCERLKRKLPEHMVPAAFVMTEQLPLTANGKIDRRALPPPELDRAHAVASYLAPRTPIEDVLTEIWRKILGLERIGIRDNFFEAGGDSLMATRLMAEVRRTLERGFAIAAFFQNPTIERMARVLQQEAKTEVEDENKAYHVVLRRGAKALAIIRADAEWIELQKAEGRMPFFMIDSFPHFIDVVKLIGADQPVISLIAHERANATASYTIEGEAARHVQTIQRVLPQGAIMLGGCSASGIVAFETARQLQKLGHEVALLALFDTINPYYMRAYSPLRRSLTFNRAELKRLRWSEIPSWMVAKLAYLAGIQTGTSRAEATGDGGPASAIEPASPQFDLSEERLAAARRYRPDPYNGRFILFKGHSDLGGRYADPQLGWGEAVRQVEVLQLGASEHIEIFKAAPDRILVAQALRRAFDEITALHPQLDQASESSHSGWDGISANGTHQRRRACENQDVVRSQL